MRMSENEEFIMTDRLLEMLKQQEGLSLVPYVDVDGKAIGYGHQLGKDVNFSISKKMAEEWLQEDIEKAVYDFSSTGLKKHLSETRQEVCINMIFNLGLGGFLTFKKAIAAMKAGDFDLAAEEMLDSKWSRQVKGRATVLAEIMRTDEWVS